MAAEHRGWSRSRPALRRYEDPAASADPRIAELVSALGTLPVAPPPRAEFRADLRTQLVAITPRIVAEAATEAEAERPRAAVGAHRAAVAKVERPRPRASLNDASAARGDRASSRPRIRIGRPLVAFAALVTVCALVLGGAVFMSRDSVPGDTLYGLKRASERFELSLADSDSERAQDHLDFAQTRVEEARELAGRPSASAGGPLADGLSENDGKLIADALGDADSDTRAAMQLLGTDAAQDDSWGPLKKMVGWLPSQRDRLGALSKVLPKGSRAEAAAAKSSRIVQEVTARAKGLQSRASCHCLKDAPTDDLGPQVPKAAPAKPGSTSTKPPSHSGPKPGSTTRRSGGATSSGGATRSGGAGGPKTTGPTRKRTGGGNPPARTTTPKLPNLPLPLPLPSSSSSKRSSSKSASVLCRVNLLGLRICSTKSP